MNRPQKKKKKKGQHLRIWMKNNVIKCPTRRFCLELQIRIPHRKHGTHAEQKSRVEEIENVQLSISTMYKIQKLRH